MITKEKYGFKKGQLFIFEGPDNVGKSTIAKKILNQLLKEKIKAKYISFPGKDTNLFGKKIYNLHHQLYHLHEQVNPLSIQLLHIASHINILENEIKNLLNENYIILLDRFWWSTWVYGKLKNINSKMLNSAIDIELIFWKNIKINSIFLFDFPKPYGNIKNLEEWNNIRSLYNQLKRKSDEKIIIIDQYLSYSTINNHILNSLKSAKFII
ncbi:MAG: hypothetical protein JST55_01860 [Bacteroidetes bacterium]|nr:hypothetical protein [Bacteroidota bacterium]